MYIEGESMLEPVKFYESEKDLKFYLIDCDSGLMHLIIFPDDTVMLFDCNVTEDNGDKILLFVCSRKLKAFIL